MTLITLIAPITLITQITRYCIGEGKHKPVDVRACRNELLLKTLRLERGEEDTAGVYLQRAIKRLSGMIFKDCECLASLTGESCRHHNRQAVHSPHVKRVFQQLRSRIESAARDLINVEDVAGGEWVNVQAHMMLGRNGKTLGQCGIQTGTKWIQMRRLLGSGPLAEWRKLWRAMMRAGEDDDLLRMGAGDPGTTTFLTVYDAYNGCLYRFGHGLASYLDRTILKQRRQIQSKIDRLQNFDNHQTEVS
jgi:hypothetical protein